MMVIWQEMAGNNITAKGNRVHDTGIARLVIPTYILEAIIHTHVMQFKLGF